MKRIFALLLAVVFIFMLITACKNEPVDTTQVGSTPNTTNETTTDSTGDTEEIEPASVSKWHDRETIDVVIAGYIQPFNNDFNNMNDPVTQHLNEKFNIRLRAIDFSDGVDFYPILTSMIVADDLPDIWSDLYHSVYELAAEGKLLDITPWRTPEFMPYTYDCNKTNAAFDLLRATRSVPEWGDAMYIFPKLLGTQNDGGGITVGHHIRWDLYAELGYPKLNTMDDLLDVLELMQETWPENDHGQKTYAISGWFGDGFGWANWPFTYCDAFYTNYDSADNGNWMIYFDKTTYHLKPGNQLLDPDGWLFSQMRWYNQAWQRGLLDPESFLMTFDMYIQKLEESRVYYTPVGWFPWQMNTHFRDNGHPERGFAFVPGLDSTSHSLIQELVVGQRPYTISANTADPERIIALMDYTSSWEFSRLAFSGIEGILWDFVDGQPVPRPEFLDDELMNEDQRKEISGAGVWSFFAGFANATRNPFDDGYMYVPTNWPNPDRMFNVHRDQLEYYGASSLFEAYSQNLTNYRSAMVYPLPVLPDELSSDYWPLATYIFENMFLLMMSKDDAAFEAKMNEMIQEFHNYNIDAIYDFWWEAAQEVEAFVPDILAQYFSR